MTFRNGTKPGSTYATVTVTLRIHVGSKWGPDTTLAQVFHQAKDDAAGILRDLIDQSTQVDYLDDMKVDAVMQVLEATR